jgi:UrcA family protein
MNREHFLPRTKQVLMAGAAACASLMGITPVMAEQPAQMTVVMPHAVYREVGATDSGIPIEEISLTVPVGFSDLDLTAQSGVATFEGRIADTAKQACSQLDTLEPLDTLDPPQDCVTSAIDGGMAQAKVVIAAAGK